MLKQKAITMIVAGSLAIVAVSGTAFAAKSAVNKKEAETTTAVTTTAENTTEPTSESVTHVETQTTAESQSSEIQKSTQASGGNSSVEKTTSNSYALAIPQTDVNGNVIPLTPEEKEAEYQKEHRLITEKYERKISRLQLLEMPEPPGEDATPEEIEKYNTRVHDVDAYNERTQFNINWAISEYNTSMENLNKRYGK